MLNVTFHAWLTRTVSGAKQMRTVHPSTEPGGGLVTTHSAWKPVPQSSTIRQCAIGGAATAAVCAPAEANTTMAAIKAARSVERLMAFSSACAGGFRVVSETYAAAGHPYSERRVRAGGTLKARKERRGGRKGPGGSVSGRRRGSPWRVGRAVRRPCRARPARRCPG